MKPRISIVTLGVRDLARAEAFYREGLGLPPVQPVEGDIRFFQLEGNMRLALYPWDKLAEDAAADPEGSGFSGITLAHNVATRAEVDAVLATADEAGGEIVKPGQEVFWGGYSGYFRDPDGHLWEVAHNPWFPLE